MVFCWVWNIKTLVLRKQPCTLKISRALPSSTVQYSTVQYSTEWCVILHIFIKPVEANLGVWSYGWTMDGCLQACPSSAWHPSTLHVTSLFCSALLCLPYNPHWFPAELIHCCTLSLCYLGAETGYRAIGGHYHQLDDYHRNPDINTEII